MKKLKTVMIGAGSRANQVIYPSFAQLPNVELAGICDPEPERLQKTADAYAIPRRYGAGGAMDYRRMVEELAPEAAVAVGQPHLLYDVWKWCLEQGLHLFIEKPPGLTLHQARALEALAERKNCITQVSFQRRYSPMAGVLREACLQRGPVTHALCRFYKCEPRDFLEARDHMLDDCIHSIDTLRWICGSEVAGVESGTRRVGTVDINFISAVLYFANGAVGHLLNSWTSGKRLFAVEMHAPGVFAEAELEGKGCLYADGNLQGVEYTAAGCAGSDDFHVYTGVLAAARDVADGCLSGRQPMCCFADAVKTMQVAEVILAQSLLREFTPRLYETL